MVPESLSVSPSIKWSPNCLRAERHMNENEQENPMETWGAYTDAQTQLVDTRTQLRLIINTQNDSLWQYF